MLSIGKPYIHFPVTMSYPWISRVLLAYVGFTVRKEAAAVRYIAIIYIILKLNSLEF